MQQSMSELLGCAQLVLAVASIIQQFCALGLKQRHAVNRQIPPQFVQITDNLSMKNKIWWLDG